MAISLVLPTIKKEKKMTYRYLVLGVLGKGIDLPRQRLAVVVPGFVLELSRRC